MPELKKGKFEKIVQENLLTKRG